MSNALLDRVYRYYLYTLEGVAGCDRPGSTSDPRNIPAWMCDMLDVGLAINALPHARRSAVDRRWEIAVLIEELRRTVLVCGQAEAIARRARDRETAEHHRQRAGMAWQHIGTMEAELARLDRSKLYRDGINEVMKRLDARKSAAMGSRIARERQASERTDQGAGTQEGAHSVAGTGEEGRSVP